MKRRTFLNTVALASTAQAIEPIARKSAQFSGLPAHRFLEIDPSNQPRFPGS